LAQISFFPQVLLAGFSVGVREHDVLQVGKLCREPQNLPNQSANMFGNMFCKNTCEYEGSPISRHKEQNSKEFLLKMKKTLPLEGPRRYTTIIYFLGTARGGTHR